MTDQLFKKIFLMFGLLSIFCSSGLTQGPDADGLLMGKPTDIVFSDDFESDSVCDRWGFRAYYSVEDGTLKRTSYKPDEAARSFLKDIVYRDVIIRFDFRFEGATEIRLMTGGGGGYNAVTQIFPEHFQVNTAKRKNEFNPSQLGDCAFKFKRGVWHTMTIEFNGDEVVSHVDGENFVLGRHPIVNTERTYLAFQVEGGAASFDNFFMWKSEPRSSWDSVRTKRLLEQTRRGSAFKRNAKEEYDLIYMNLKDRLSRTDSVYRQIVARHAEIEGKMKIDFPSANQSHKELAKRIASTKKEMRKENPRFKEMEQSFNRSRRAIKDYVHSMFPELDELPKQKYYWKYEECLVELADDAKLLSLIKYADQAEKRLHASFPEAFQDIEILVDERKLSQTRLKSNEDYRALRNQIAESNRAVEAYLFKQEPRLAELSESRMAIIKSKK